MLYTTQSLPCTLQGGGYICIYLQERLGESSYLLCREKLNVISTIMDIDRAVDCGLVPAIYIRQFDMQ